MKSKRLLCLFLFMFVVYSTWGYVEAAPICITLNTIQKCQAGNFFGEITQCCPPAAYTKGPVVDFIPKRDRHPGPLRVRKALQCLSGDELSSYSEKLWKAYELMQALPQDDPRSFYQQNAMHCAYGSGAFVQDGTGNLTIDIHFNWYFSPWHRMFLYFHERILQSLLDDPTFTLHFWNFDNSFDAEKANRNKEGCFRVGHFFPELYSDPSKSTFHANRSVRPFTANLPADLSILNRSETPLRFVSEAVPRNKEVMHRSMQPGKSPLDFHGWEFKYGQPQNLNISGGGSLEFLPHNSIHRWIGGSTSLTTHAPEDPIFYVFHSNLERLWDVWQRLGGGRKDPSSPDWLDAEFLFYDENAVLRRVKVKDSLVMKDFGYTYERVFDESWLFFDNSTLTPVKPSN
ncbi:polyphenol oxidase [Marchantia polymorpha subsp. ruderalis]|uniref:Tyrosinase copper-binding domain-containing protein n=1 Tax=Marchantia polymorpha TaxID=3197 RepID=A0A2R6XDH5_MARPO|nr:hypothetical protein MARPO_0021s0037 [Marchantia polymorpha]BBN01235.1 hypothetical protein Mp_2g05810 [Marchantia polymorpha subsp. ruderalis]|eukprot:PTQ44161.1 hypothetical protein MARPO_0021s0037 [Marchantia polymorpha]